jgi:hypothetical protein
MSEDNKGGKQGPPAKKSQSEAYVPGQYDWHAQLPPQYFNRSEDEIELQSTRDANFGKVAQVSKPRAPEQYQGGRLFDDNLLFEAHTPLAQLE